MERAPSRVIEEFKVVDNRKLATIKFVNGVFSDCSYSLSGVYDYKDWMFLGQVATTIRDITDEKGGKSD